MRGAVSMALAYNQVSVHYKVKQLSNLLLVVTSKEKFI